MSKSEKTIFRAPHDKDNPFTMASNEVIRDRRLTPEARCLMLYFLSLPDDWVLVHKYIIKDFGIKRGILDRCLDELIKLGYVVRTREKEGNLLSSYKYKVYEKPINEMPSQVVFTECSKSTLGKNGKKIINFSEREVPSQVVFTECANLECRETAHTKTLATDPYLAKTKRDSGNVHNSSQAQSSKHSPPSNSSFSNEKKEQSKISSLTEPEQYTWLIDVFRLSTGLPIQPKVLTRWLGKHGPKYVVERIEYLQKEEKKKFIANPEAYLEESMKSDWPHTAEMRKFAKEEDLKQRQRHKKYQ